MDGYTYQAKISSLASQIVTSRANGTGPMCIITLDVTGPPGAKEDLVAHLLREKLESVGVYITVSRATGLSDTFICRVEGEPATLYKLLTQAYLEEGIRLHRAK